MLVPPFLDRELRKLFYYNKNWQLIRLKRLENKKMENAAKIAKPLPSSSHDNNPAVPDQGAPLRYATACAA
jgi:hypothetical protein